MAGHMELLARLVDDALIAFLPDALKDAVRLCLERGATPHEIVRRVRAQAGASSLLSLSVEAFLERLSPWRPN